MSVIHNHFRGKYGKLACCAAKALLKDSDTPLSAWKKCTEKIFPDSESGREKSCPRNAFLGLVEAGLLNGVEIRTENKTKESVNKEYAVKAYKLICSDISLLDRKKELWSIVVGGAQKAQNQQIDVVVSLWEEGYLKKSE